MTECLPIDLYKNYEMKQKYSKTKYQLGFTLIELLVVISIMGILATLMIVNFAGQRVSRSLLLAKNETVTNIRKVQSYTLSSKNIFEDVPAKYYVIHFESGSGIYYIDAIDNTYKYHSITDKGALPGVLESITLPGDLYFSDLRVALSTDPEGKSQSYRCLDIIISTPFGKMYASGQDFNSDEKRCTKFDPSILQDPIELTKLGQYRAYLDFPNSTTSIQINPATGQVGVY